MYTIDPAAGPDRVSRNYYVSSCAGARVRLLVGPFATPLQAAAWVDAAEGALLSSGEIEQALAVRVTAVLSEPSQARDGDLNQLLGAAARV